MTIQTTAEAFTELGLAVRAFVAVLKKEALADLNRVIDWVVGK